MKTLAFLGAICTTIILFAVSWRFAGLIEGWLLNEMAAGPSRRHTVIISLLISVPTVFSGIVVPLIIVRRWARGAHLPAGSRP